MFFQPCANPNQVQTRTRTKLRQPSDDPVYICPALLDEKLCVRGDNCVVYEWLTAPWTSCLINNGTEECGVGYRERFTYCVDEHGRTVEDRFCIKVRSSNQIAIENCYLCFYIHTLSYPFVCVFSINLIISVCYLCTTKFTQESTVGKCLGNVHRFS